MEEECFKPEPEGKRKEKTCPEKVSQNPVEITSSPQVSVDYPYGHKPVYECGNEGGSDEVKFQDKGKGKTSDKVCHGYPLEVFLKNEHP